MMVNWIVSSCVLILAVIAIRYLFREKLSSRVQYALWGLVLLRLLLPVSVGSSSVSVANLPEVIERQPVVESVVEAVRTPIQVQSYQEAYSQVAQRYEAQGQPVSAMQGVQLETFEKEVREQMNGETLAQILKRIARWVWLLGVAVVAGVFLVTNLRLSVLLRKNSRKLEAESELPVYAVRGLDTPCLYGLLRPAVYVTEDAAQDPTVLRHAIAHEMTHHCHGDHIWSALRGVCLVLHWYNPLVWWAAILSQRDGELACDEATILRLGEGERAAYVRTLIEMTCGKKTNMLLSATTMTAGGIKERIRRIARKPKTAVVTLVIVLLIAFGIVGCTFTGSHTSGDNPTEPAQTVPAQTDPTIDYLNAQIGGIPKDAVMVCDVSDLEGKDVSYAPVANIRDNLNTYYHYGYRLEQNLRETLRTAVAGTEQLILSGSEGCYVSVREITGFQIHDPGCAPWFICYLFSEGLEPAGEIVFYLCDGEVQFNKPALYGDRTGCGNLRYMVQAPEREYILVTNSYWNMLLDENNQVHYGNTQLQFEVRGDYFHALDWENMAVSYSELIAQENLVWLSFVTSEMIHKAAQQDLERLICYLPYVDGLDYEKTYGSEGVFALLDLVKEWVFSQPTYDRMKTAMTQIHFVDGASADYYGIMLTDLFEVNKAVFANICLNDLSEEQEKLIISFIAYDWGIAPEEARAILEEALPK